MKKYGVTNFLLLLAITGVLIVLPGAGFINNAHGDILIVANKSVQMNFLKKAELRDIFLGNTIKWKDRSRINIVVQRDGKAHNEFVKEITQKSASQFRNYWKKMVFTGKGSTPKTIEKSDELLAYVAATEGAIGYVAAGIQPEGVKIIKIND